MDRAIAAARAHVMVRDDILHALEQDPERHVSTPEYRCGSMAASDIVLDFAFGDEAMWHSIVKLVMNARAGVDVQLQASLLVSIWVHKHVAKQEYSVAAELAEVER